MKRWQIILGLVILVALVFLALGQINLTAW